MHKITEYIQLKYMLFLVIINACTHIHMWGFVHPKNATILAPFNCYTYKKLKLFMIN